MSTGDKFTAGRRRGARVCRCGKHWDGNVGAYFVGSRGRRSSGSTVLVQAVPRHATLFGCMAHPQNAAKRVTDIPERALEQARMAS